MLGGIAALFVAFVLALVATSLSRPEVQSYAPSLSQLTEVGSSSAGPTLYTVDATSLDSWVYFDFSRGSAFDVMDRRSMDWDIAFRRHRMLTNSGATNPAVGGEGGGEGGGRGGGGVLDLGDVSLDSAFRVPAHGYVVDEGRAGGESLRNRVLEEWYDYSWTSHLLTPADRTYVIRTADGRYAALRFISYYCPGAVPGCVTFRYRYLGDGSRVFEGL